ncbi:NADH-quinone oxidoreductase subunit N [Ekhidna sp.]|uniref:NADH-quinone oxidoreductase subunit N n=1 Tax=Ekhidna sp. TaxID=2608089 RepID=UPI003CCC0EAA
MNLNDQLTGILNDLQGVWVESTLILGAILILILGLIKENNWVLKGCFLVVILLAFYLNLSSNLDGFILEESLQLTRLSRSFTAIFILVAFLLLIFNRSSRHLSEFYFFILAMLVGSTFMMKANSLLIIYLSIELASLASYVLTNFTFKKRGFEAGIKYLLFGAISSAVMLFGLGLIYGTTGTFFISEWGTQTFDSLLSQVGFIFLLFGIFFKISLAPSHIWVPATYQAAPPDATAFMSIVPKLAGLVLLMRIFDTNSFSENHWVIQLVMVLGMITLIIGTLGALLQQNARRMISFGAIAHSGFLLPFALMGNDFTQEAFWYYAVVYAIMNLAAFYLLDIYERQEVNTVSDYANTNKSVWLGASFTLILISLIGIPPVAGFTAKFFLFTNLWENYQLAENSIYLWYLIVAVLATVGSLFFYLQIPKQIFLSQPEDLKSFNFKNSTKILATLFCIVLLLLFFVPQLVMEAQQLVNNVHE